MNVNSIKLICISDIHGEIDKLNDILHNYPLRENEKYVFIGDYVDRGKDSLKVIRKLMDIKKEGKGYFILGNHDYVFYNNILFFSQKDIKEECHHKIEIILKNQLEGFESFLEGSPYENFINRALDLTETDKDNYKKLIDELYNISNYILYNYKEELDFIKQCILYIETDKYLISHSGGNMDKPIEDNEVLDWIETRMEFHSKFTDKVRIYGHTPTLSGKVEISENKVMIDTGADFRNIPLGVFISEDTKINKIKYWYEVL